jgi:hypothetical protein
LCEKIPNSAPGVGRKVIFEAKMMGVDQFSEFLLRVFKANWKTVRTNQKLVSFYAQRNNFTLPLFR